MLPLPSIHFINNHLEPTIFPKFCRQCVLWKIMELTLVTLKKGQSLQLVNRKYVFKVMGYLHKSYAQETCHCVVCLPHSRMNFISREVVAVFPKLHSIVSRTNFPFKCEPDNVSPQGYQVNHVDWSASSSYHIARLGFQALGQIITMIATNRKHKL